MNNALARAIQLEKLTGTAAEIAAAFLADVEIKSSSSQWTYKGLAIKFGRDAVGLIDETLKSIPGLDWVRLSLASTDGLDFAAEETQAGLKALRDGGAFSKEVAAGLLALGVESKPLWQKHGLDSTPTKEQCTDALTRIATQQKWAQVSNEIVPPMLTAGNTWAEIVAALQETI